MYLNQPFFKSTQCHNWFYHGNSHACKPCFHTATEPKVNKHRKCWGHFRCCIRLNTTSMWCLENNNSESRSLIAKFVWPTRGPSRVDKTQVGPMLASWSLLPAVISCNDTISYKVPWAMWYNGVQSVNTSRKTLLIKETLKKCLTWY